MTPSVAGVARGVPTAFAVRAGRTDDIDAGIALASGGGYLAALALTLLAAAALGRRAWLRQRAEWARQLWLGPVCLLSVLALGVALAALFAAAQLHPRLWLVPFERLLTVTALVALGWTLAGPAAARRWRPALAGGLALTVAAYAGWAPVWAREVQRHPELALAPMGWARAWDLAQAALAFSLAVWLARRGPGLARWVPGAVALLGLGSLLDLAAPGHASFPAWSRLGALAGAAVLAAGAALESLPVVTGRRPRALSRAARLWERLELLLPSDGRDGPVGADGDAGPVYGDGPDMALGQALRSAAERLVARPVFAALLTADGRLAVHGLASAAGEPCRLGVLPLEAYPTLQRALREGRVTVMSTHLTPDLDRLFGRVSGLPVGPAILQRIGAERPLGVLVAGRRRGPWESRHAAALEDVARRTAASLEALAAREQVVGQAARAMSAIQAHGQALARLAHTVDDIGGRVDALERGQDRPLLPRETDAGAPAEAGAPADAGARADPGPSDPAVPTAPVDGMGPTVAAGSDASAAPGADGARGRSANGAGSGLLPDMAAELQAPIASLLGYSDLLGRGAGLAPEQVDRFLRRIDANLARMQVMLGNLGAMAGLDAPAQAAVLEDVDVARALRAAAARAEPQLREKSLVLKVEVEEGLPAARVAQGAAELVLDNLLANAVQRSPQGGDILAGARAAGSGPARFVVLTVRDRGHAPRAAPGTAFELDDVDAGPVAMRLVRLLCARQGGRAWAERGPGGVSFHARLPVAPGL